MHSQFFLFFPLVINNFLFIFHRFLFSIFSFCLFECFTLKFTKLIKTQKLKLLGFIDFVSLLSSFSPLLPPTQMNEFPFMLSSFPSPINRLNKKNVNRFCEQNENLEKCDKNTIQKSINFPQHSHVKNFHWLERWKFVYLAWKLRFLFAIDSLLRWSGLQFWLGVHSAFSELLLKLFFEIIISQLFENFYQKNSLLSAVFSMIIDCLAIHLYECLTMMTLIRSFFPHFYIIFQIKISIHFLWNEQRENKIFRMKKSSFFTDDYF